MLDTKEERNELVLLTKEFIKKNNKSQAHNRRIECKLDAIYKETREMELSLEEPSNTTAKKTLDNHPPWRLWYKQIPGSTSPFF